MSLPSGYKRLEYIQSTGTQYVDSAFIPNGETSVEIEFESAVIEPTLDGYYPVYGAASAFDSNAFELWSLGYGFCIYGSQGYKSGFGLSANVKYISKQTKNVLEINNQTLNFTKQTFTAPYNLLIFATHRSGGIIISASDAKLKVYYCKIYDNGTLVRDFIPCKKPDGTIGLWDDVNSVFYGNAGTGTFTAGPEVGVATPENFRLSSSTETTATLAWSAVDGATGYKLYRDGILIATLTDTSYTDTIQPFTSYIYTLTAYNDSGESDPASISVQIIIPPETPSNFRASSASMTAISLAWDAVTGADSYQLKRDGSVIYSGEGTSYTDSGLTAETAYTYTLSAVNTAGSSAETTLEAATTQFILVTDRTQADVAARNAKGTYNASDLNRVGAAVQYVADLLHGLGYGFTVSPKTDWKETDWPTSYDMERYLLDVSTLRGLITQMETTPDVPNSMEKLTHWTANDIEQILMDIDDAITRMKTSLFYASEIYSGEV